MKAVQKIRIDEHEYTLAMPIGAYEDVAAINPYFQRMVRDLQGDDCNFKHARMITDIALSHGGSGVTSETVFERHGYPAWQQIALFAMLLGFVSDEPEDVKKKRPVKSDRLRSTNT